MAVERGEQLFSLPLGQFIERHVSNYQNQVKGIRAVKEADYLRKVVDNGFSYSEQLEYRKKQVEEEESALYPDSMYLRELKSEVTNLNKLIRAERFREKYNLSYQELKESKRSIDEHLSFLQSELDSATDEDLKAKIQEQVNEAVAVRYESQNAILSNKVTFALNDKTKPILTSTLSEVKKRQNEALVGGNEAESTAWALKAQNLEQALTKAEIEDAIHDLDVKVTTQGNVTATDYLNFFSQKLGSAAADGKPFTYNNKQYNSQRDFWQAQLSDFMKDRQGGFFPMLQNELKERIDTAKLSLAPVLESELKATKDQLDQLSSYEEVAPYSAMFQNMTKTTLSYGVDEMSKKILNDYSKGIAGATANKNIENSITKLNQLNATYGVDVQGALTQIINDVQQKKLSAAQTMIGLYQDQIQRGVGEEQAWRFASQNTAAVDLPVNDILQNSVENIARTSFKGSPKTEIGGAQKTPEQQPTAMASRIPEGEFVKEAGSPTVYQSKGGKLLELTGNWTTDDFKKYSGKGWEAVKTLSSVAGQQVERGAVVSPTEQARIKAEEDARMREQQQAAIQRQQEQIQQTNQPKPTTQTPTATQPTSTQSVQQPTVAQPRPNLRTTTGQTIDYRDPNYEQFKKGGATPI